MELFVQTEVFNPELVGKAVYIKGHDVDGEECDRVVLVNSADGEFINLTNRSGKIIRLHIENFTYDDDHGLKLTVLEVI